MNLQVIHSVIDKVPEFPYFLLILFYILLSPGDIRRYVHIFSTAFIFLFVGLIVGLIIKLTLKTGRPRHYSDILFLRYGFPSLHSLISVGAIAFVYFVDYRLSLILLPIGLFYIYSRIKLGVHTPRDVIGGAIIGTILGIFIGAYGLKIYLPERVEFILMVMFFILPPLSSITRISFLHRT